MSIENIVLRQLTNNDFIELLDAINHSFADYIEPFKLNEEQLKFKIISEDIVLHWSVGVFLDSKLVAFIMHGVRALDSKKIVYNAGTGVLPEYRGKGLVGKMYEFILPFLEQNHVNKLVLEVIENNSSAIRAYEKDGFSIYRKLLCFSGKIRAEVRNVDICILPLNRLIWSEFLAFWDIQPSWQSYINSMDNSHVDSLGAFIDGDLVGYVLYSKDRKRIYQIAVSPNQRRRGIASNLIKETYKEMNGEEIQINNVDSAYESLRFFIEKQGLVNDVNQFEMIKNIS